MTYYTYCKRCNNIFLSTDKLYVFYEANGGCHLNIRSNERNDIVESIKRDVNNNTNQQAEIGTMPSDQQVNNSIISNNDSSIYDSFFPQDYNDENGSQIYFGKNLRSSSRYAPYRIFHSKCNYPIGSVILKTSPENNKPFIYCLDHEFISIDQSFPTTGLSTKTKWKNVPTDQFMKVGIEIIDYKIGITNAHDYNNQSPNSGSELEITSTSTIQHKYLPTVIPEKVDLKLMSLLNIKDLYDFQVESLYQSMKVPTLLTVPTGYGKTVVSILLIKQFYEFNGRYVNDEIAKRMVLFVTSRVPLVRQQSTAMQYHLGSEYSICRLHSGFKNTLDFSNSKRPDIIVSTPGSIENLFAGGVVSAKDFYLVIFDEAHHCAKSHPYVRISKQFTKIEPELQPWIFGMSASPTTGVSTPHSIKELETMLRAKLYVPPSIDVTRMSNTQMCIVEYSLNESDRLMINSIESLVQSIIETFLEEIESYNNPLNYHSIYKGMFIYHIRMLEKYCFDTNNSSTTYRPNHLIILLEFISIIESEGLTIFKHHLMEQVEREDNLAFKSRLQELLSILNSFSSSDIQHNNNNTDSNSNSNGNNSNDKEYISNKFNRFKNNNNNYTLVNNKTKFKVLEEIIEDNLDDEMTAIIFTQSKSTVKRILKILKKKSYNSKLKAKRLIGHTNLFEVDGMDVFEQQETLDKFANRECRLLVATTVLEEGIDIPNCNLIICYDDDLHLRSMIQRRGRARSEESKFYLMKEFKSAEDSLRLSDLLSQEKNMNRTIAKISRNTRISYDSEEFLESWRQFHQHSVNNGELQHNSSIDTLVFIFYYINNQPAEEIKKLFTNGSLNLRQFQPIHNSEQYLSIKLMLSVEMSISLNTMLETLKDMFSSANLLFSLNFNQNTQHTINQGLSSSLMRVQVHLQCGNFIDQITFSRSFAIPRVELYIKNGNLSFRYHHSNKLIEVVVLQKDLFHRVFYDISSDHHYVVLNRMPRILVLNKYDPTIVEGRMSHMPLAPIDSPFTVFSFKLKNQNHTILSYLLNIPLVYSSFKWSTHSITSLQQHNPSFQYPNHIKYLLSVLQCNKKFSNLIIPQSFYHELEALLKENALLQAEYLIFCALESPAFTYPTWNSVPPFKSIPKAPNEYYCWVKKAYLTPTRIFFQKPVMIQTNRAIRIFGPDRFLMVQITEEDLSESIDYQPLITKILSDRFLNGIQVEGYGKFHFLGYSNSQLRRNTSWFYCDDNWLSTCITNNSSDDVNGLVEETHESSTNNVENISYKMEDVKKILIGDIESFINPRQYLRALSLVFPSTIPTISFEQDQIHEIPDIISKTGQIFSDGVGYIGRESAAELIQSTALPPETCAFQIRIAGYKGVVAIHPKIERGIYLRPSMNKFSADTSLPHNNTLELISISNDNICHLNRQVINLFSGLGVPDSYFLKMLKQALMKLADMLQDPTEVLKYSDELAWLKSISKEDINTDPMIRSIIHLIYQKNVAEYSDKCFIPVEKAKTVIGILDESGTLESGQVFFSAFNSETNVTHVVSGDIAVCKNPCLHPGDVRKLKAVNVPHLHHLRNVIVFSSKGDTPDFKKCSGSDLDGDRYFCCYDPEVTSTINQYKDYHYEDPKMKNSILPITQSSIINQYLNSIDKGILGQIALTHLAICDRLTPSDPLAIELAIQHSIEVDSPKTGEHGVVPDRASAVIGNFESFPLYMEKSLPNKKYWNSRKILGILYEQCKQMKSIAGVTEKSYDPDRIVDGYEKYLDNATNSYQQYQNQIQLLLNRFGIQTEQEIIVQYVEYCQESGQINKPMIKEAFKNYHQIQKQFTLDFLTEFLPNPHEKRLEIDQKVAAYYHCSYQEQPFHYYSFYWIVKQFFSGKQNATMTINEDDNHLKTPIDIVNYFNAQSLEMFKIYTNRLQIVESLENTLRSHHPGFANSKLLMYGSSSLFLFNPYSDMDLYLHAPNLQGSCLEKSSIYKEIQSIFTNYDDNIKNIEIVENAMYPIIRFRTLQTNCDLSQNDNGFKKTILVSEYYRKYPFLLPLSYAIIQWGRESGLLSGLVDHASTLERNISENQSTSNIGELPNSPFLKQIKSKFKIKAHKVKQVSPNSHTSNHSTSKPKPNKPNNVDTKSNKPKYTIKDQPTQQPKQTSNTDQPPHILDAPSKEQQPHIQHTPSNEQLPHIQHTPSKDQQTNNTEQPPHILDAPSKEQQPHILKPQPSQQNSHELHPPQPKLPKIKKHQPTQAQQSQPQKSEPQQQPHQTKSFKHSKDKKKQTKQEKESPKNKFSQEHQTTVSSTNIQTNSPNETGLNSIPVEKQRTLKTWSLLWMVIHYCLQKKIIQPIEFSSISKNNTVEYSNRPSEWWIKLYQLIQVKDEHTHQLSDYIRGFFRFYIEFLGSSIDTESKLVIKCPLDDDTPSLVVTPSSTYLFECFQVAYHTLSSSPNFSAFLKRSLYHNIKYINLDSRISKVIREQEEYFESRINAKSGSEVRLHRVNGKRYQLKVKGDPYAIQFAIEEITNLANEISRLPIRKIKNIVSGGGTNLVFEGCQSHNEMIKFIDLNIPHNIHIYHIFKRPFRPILLQTKPSLKNREAFMEFSKKFYNQMEKIYRNHNEIDHGHINAYLRFGSIYLINAPFSGYQKSVAETRNSLNSGRKMFSFDVNGNITKGRLPLDQNNQQSPINVIEGDLVDESVTEDIGGSSIQSMKLKMNFGKVENKTASPMNMKPKLAFYSYVYNHSNTLQKMLSLGWTVVDPSTIPYGNRDYYSFSFFNFASRIDMKLLVSDDMVPFKVSNTNLSWFTCDYKSTQRTKSDIDVRYSVQSKKTHNEYSYEYEKYMKKDIVSKFVVPPTTLEDQQVGTNKLYTLSPEFRDAVYLVRNHQNIIILNPPPNSPLKKYNISAQIRNTIELTNEGNLYNNRPELEFKIDLPKKEDIHHFINLYWNFGQEMIIRLNKNE